MQYLIPSVISLDSSKIQLFKNQATCDPATILNGQDLQNINGPLICGAVDQNDFDLVHFCLTGSVSDVSQFVGLTVNTGGAFTPESRTIVSCVEDAGFGSCPDTAYRCQVDSDFNERQCVLSLECPDGTTITSCPNNTDCVGFGNS
jgi:hypothetical protein